MLGNNIRGVSGAMMGANAFSPAGIPDGLVWFDASDAATITESGGAVSQWDNKFGTGNDVTQATEANRPATGVNTLNGRNTITFDGTSDFLIKAGFPMGVSVTVFIAAQVLAVSASTSRSLLSVNSANDFQIDAGVASQFRARLASSNLGSTSPPLHASNLLGVPSVLTYRLSATDSEIAVRVNGTLSDTDTYNGALSGSQALRLGVNRSLSAFLNVDIAEVIIYDRDLTAQEITGVESYLMTKWGITG